MTEDLPLEEKVIVYPIPSLRQNDYKNNPSRYIHILSRTPRLSTQNPTAKDRPSVPNPNTPNPNPPEAHTHAGTRYTYKTHPRPSGCGLCISYRPRQVLHKQAAQV